MYLWKSGVFSDMSYYDYACCVRPIRSSPNDELENRDNRKGRQKLERYPFEGFGCPIPDSMAQVLTCIPTVPILAGAPPPSSPGRRPPLDADEMSKYCGGGKLESSFNTMHSYFSRLDLTWTHLIQQCHIYGSSMG